MSFKEYICLYIKSKASINFCSHDNKISKKNKTGHHSKNQTSYINLSTNKFVDT